MSSPVDTLPSSMTIAEAVAYFTDDAEAPDRHRSYPVVDAKGLAVGMISRADILRWTRHGWGEGQTLATVTGELTVGYADELVAQLADRMATRDVGRVPVVERQSGKLVGLVARRDLLRVRGRVRTEELYRAKLLRVRGRRRDPAAP
jgi:CBS domain-containing protein